MRLRHIYLIFNFIILFVILLACKIEYEINTTGSHYYKGIEYCNKGEFESARVEFESDLAIDSLHETFEWSKRCLSVVEDVLRQKVGRQAAIYLFRGINYGNKGEIEQAIEEIRNAIENDSDYAPLYYMGQELYHMAISDFS